jgi:hypothetical protein
MISSTDGRKELLKELYVCIQSMYWVFMNSVYAVYGVVYNASNAMIKYKNGLMV